MCTCRKHDPFALRRCQGRPADGLRQLWADVSHCQDSIIERLRERLADERTRRLDDLRKMQAKHDSILAQKETARLDAIQLAETRRVDANRAADAAAVLLAVTRAELTASTLAEKVTDSAVTLASQVEQTKIAAAAGVDATTETLGGRIKPLEDARYEQAGRTGGRLDVTKVLWAVVAFLTPIVLYLLATRPGVVAP